MQLEFEGVKTHTNYLCEVFMDNKALAKMIREKYYEKKMSAEYKLQLNKVVDFEDKFLKYFSKENWKEYQYLDIEKKVNSTLSKLTKLLSLLLSF